MWTTLSKHHSTECLCLFVCLCLCFCACVYGCVKVVSGNTITNSINHLTPMFIIFTMNFLVFFYWLLFHTESCYVGQTFQEWKKTCEDWNVLSTYFTYSLPLVYDYISTKFIVVHLHALTHSISPPSSSIPLSPSINFCLCPYSCCLPFNLSPEKMNLQFIQLDIWRKKTTRCVCVWALYSFWSFDHYWQYSILTEVSTVCLSQCISFKSLSLHMHTHSSSSKDFYRTNISSFHCSVYLLGILFYACGIFYWISAFSSWSNIEFKWHITDGGKKRTGRDTRIRNREIERKREQEQEQKRVIAKNIWTIYERFASTMCRWPS